MKLKLGILVVLVVMSAISGFNNDIISGANAAAEHAISLAMGLQDESYQEQENDYDTDEVGYPDNYGQDQEGYSSYNYYGSNEYGSYGESYNNIGYDESNTYSDYGTYYPPEKPDKKNKFTCPDTGIIVDKEENCPVVCPPGSLLEGQLAVPGSDLEQICNFPDVEICAEETDLAGLLVADTDGNNDGLEDACFLTVCPDGTALEGVAISFEQNAKDDTGPAGIPDMIPDICTINGLEKCPPGTPQSGHFVMGDGDLSTTVPEDQMLTRICNADGDQAEVCPERTDLAGVLVENAPEDCVLNSCPEGTALEGVVLNFTQFNTDLTGPNGEPDMIPDICTINFVTEQDKECQICATRALIPFDGEGLTDANDALDDFPTPTSDPRGLTALCELEGQELRDEWCDSIATGTGSVDDDSNEIFNDCLTAAGFGGVFPTEGACTGEGLTAGNVGSQSSSSDSALQTSSSNMQPNNLESQKFNQNVEVNKNMEQPKKTSILPWFKFNHQ